jgi:CRISPR-associated protein Cas2
VDPLVQDWWEDLLPSRPHLSPPGIKEMLRIIVYDIACPRRLRRIAQTCLDFGVRVQKSVFECWLDDENFDRLWQSLAALIVQDEDSLVAYTLDAPCARERRAAGCAVVSTERRSCYAF